VKDIFKLKELPDAQTLTKLAEPWRPYRNFEAWVSLAQPGTVGASRGGVISVLSNCIML